MEKLGRDRESRTARWDVFGGNGGAIDAEMDANEDLTQLVWSVTMLVCAYARRIIVMGPS